MIERLPIEQRKQIAVWLLALATQVHDAVMNDNDNGDHTSRNRGTVTNLCPEIAKTASKLNKASKNKYK